MIRRFKNSRKQTSFKTPRKNKWIIIPFFLAICLGFFLYLIFFKFLIVKKVKLDPQMSCFSGEQASAALAKNTNILFVNKSKLATDFQKKFFCLADLQIKRVFPDILVLVGKERIGALIIEKLTTPDIFDQGEKLAKTIDASFSATLEATKEASLIKTLNFEVKSASFSSKLVLDSSGFAFLDNPQSQDLPKIAGFFPGLELGKKIDSTIVKNSIEILQKLKELQIETTSVKITQGIYLLIVGNYQKTTGNQKDLKLAFLLTGNHLQELASLQLILQRNKIDLKSIESIDLRFDKPIVVYMNGKR